MAQYYFAAAYLPFLTYETEKTISTEKFRELCMEQLSKKDNMIIENTGISRLEIETPLCGALEKWIARETALRNELAQLRRSKKNLDTDEQKSDTAADPYLQDLAGEAFSQESPLAAEDILNRARWGFLDELEFGHYFDIDKLVIYYLKLQILERKNSFNYQKGKEIFTEYFKTSSAEAEPHSTE